MDIKEEFEYSSRLWPAKDESSSLDGISVKYEPLEVYVGCNSEENPDQYSVRLLPTKDESSSLEEISVKNEPIEAYEDCSSDNTNQLMSATPRVKRRVDLKHRTFNPEWEKYFFIERFGQAQCLICFKTVAVLKEVNVRRHWEAEHRSSNFAAMSAAERKDAIVRLSASLQKTTWPDADEKDVPTNTSPSLKEPEQPQMKRRNKDFYNQLLYLACRDMCEPVNECLQLTKAWATELSKMDKTQQTFAKKGINDVLFEGQMGTLNRNSVQINTALSRSSTSYSYPISQSPHYLEMSDVSVDQNI